MLRTALALALTCSLAVGADAPPDTSKGVIRIVSSLPRTGSANAQTTTMVNGIRMAIDEAHGAVAGFAIQYEDWDDASPQKGAWDAAVEASNAEKAVKDGDVMVYIGTYNSGAAKIAMPTLNNAGLAMISPANTAVGLTKPGKGEANEPMVYRPSGKVTYFRVVPADDMQGAVGAQWARDLGAKKIYILHDRELYGEGLAKVFRDTAPGIGLQIVGYEGINPKEPNYRSLVAKIKDAGAELVYFGGTTQTNAGQIAKDLVAGGFSGKFMVPDGCYEKAFIESAGAANVEDRACITFGGVPPERLTGKGKAFVDAYQVKYGAMPEGYAVYAYECAKVAIEAIRRVGAKDRAKITEAVAATKDFDGALGRWSFDANGDTTLTMLSGNTVKNGDFAFVKLLSLDAPAAPTGYASSSAPANASDTSMAGTSGTTTTAPSKGSPLLLIIVAAVVVVVVLFLVLRKPNE